MVSKEAIPTPDETRNQLARMLASKRFKAAKNQADFLEFIVSRTLLSQKVTGAIIGRHLFGEKFQPGLSPDVRVTANSLREKLNSYYENEGRDDPIIIRLPDPPKDRRLKLPEGEAYRPIFTYNANAEIAKEYELGLYFLSPKRPFELYDAMLHFKNVLTLNSLHAGASIGMVEAACLLTLMNWETGIFVNAALEGVPKALANAHGSWHAHASAGAAFLLAFEIQQSRNEFETALSLDSVHTSHYGWYHGFLLATGQHARAVLLARQRAHAHVRDPMVHAIYSVFLYMTRQYEEALLACKRSIDLDRNCWLAYLCSALVEIARGQWLNGRVSLAIVDHSLQKSAEPFLPGLTGMAHLLDEDHNPQVVKIVQEHLASERILSPVQHALFQMGCGANEHAINCLKIAWKSYEPIFLFLHLIPLFDPLRGNEPFEQLVRDRLNPRPQPPLDSVPRKRTTTSQVVSRSPDDLSGHSAS